ncbi:hypothetical protein ACFQZ2_12355 [Streptomonospora algeriensis]|uniref:Uncharacterized protein n=1 Tax=Streptomonospora algeriensis TaxID=995084 RepID=A0ABW3BGF3_9ACTN
MGKSEEGDRSPKREGALIRRILLACVVRLVWEAGEWLLQRWMHDDGPS